MTVVKEATDSVEALGDCSNVLHCVLIMFAPHIQEATISLEVW